jgi:prolyl-tRNA synthetase
MSFQVRIVRRDNGTKVDIPSADLVEQVRMLLDGIQVNLLETAKQKRDACIAPVNTWDEFTAALNEKKLILAPWCDEEVSDVLTYIFHIPPSTLILFSHE